MEASPTPAALPVPPAGEDFVNWSGRFYQDGRVAITNEEGGQGTATGCIVWNVIPASGVEYEESRECNEVADGATVTFGPPKVFCGNRYEIDWQVNGNLPLWKVIDVRSIECKCVPKISYTGEFAVTYLSDAGTYTIKDNGSAWLTVYLARGNQDTRFAHDPDGSQLCLWYGSEKIGCAVATCIRDNWHGTVGYLCTKHNSCEE
jgi:hypothetical protein